MSMADERSLAERGKNCIAVASEVLQCIEMGQAKAADTKLILMERDASILANEADKFAKRLEAVDQFYQKKDAKLHHEVGQLGMKEDQLKREKGSIESNLAGQRSVLQDRESKLSSAESDLRSAERKLKNAIEEEKKIQIGSAVGGAILGLFTGGIGALIGAGVGASIGAIVNACRDEEKDARAARNRRRSDVDSAKSAIRSSENQISSLESQISNLSSKIQGLKRQRDEVHKKRTDIKEAIPMLKNSTQFWHLFKQLSQTGVDRTALLQKIIGKANEKGNYKALQTRGAQRTTNSFFEAWESIEVLATEGCSDHIFSIQYTCAKCTRSCNALPHLNDSEFICSACHLAIMN